MRRVILTAILVLTTFAPASAEVRILASPGGDVVPYMKLFALMKLSGERVVIDGPCLSACTLLLSAVPRERICVTRRAVLGFHAAKLVDGKGRKYSAGELTRLLTATYPPPVRAWISRHGGLTSKPIFLKGRELAALYRPCA